MFIIAMGVIPKSHVISINNFLPKQSKIIITLTLYLKEDVYGCKHKCVRRTPMLPQQTSTQTCADGTGRT